MWYKFAQIDDEVLQNYFNIFYRNKFDPDDEKQQFAPNDEKRLEVLKKVLEIDEYPNLEANWKLYADLSNRITSDSEKISGRDIARININREKSYDEYKWFLFEKIRNEVYKYSSELSPNQVENVISIIGSIHNQAIQLGPKLQESQEKILKLFDTNNVNNTVKILSYLTRNELFNLSLNNPDEFMKAYNIALERYKEQKEYQKQVESNIVFEFPEHTDIKLQFKFDGIYPNKKLEEEDKHGYIKENYWFGERVKFKIYGPDGSNRYKIDPLSPLRYLGTVSYIDRYASPFGANPKYIIPFKRNRELLDTRCQIVLDDISAQYLDEYDHPYRKIISKFLDSDILYNFMLQLYQNVNEQANNIIDYINKLNKNFKKDNILAIIINYLQSNNQINFHEFALIFNYLIAKITPIDTTQLKFISDINTYIANEYVKYADLIFEKYNQLDLPIQLKYWVFFTYYNAGLYEKAKQVLENYQLSLDNRIKENLNKNINNIMKKNYFFK